MEKLSLRQKMFINEYFGVLGNATEAAMRAYCFKSRNVAGVTGYRLLRNVNVSRVIDDVLDKAGLSNDAIAKDLKDIVNLGSLKGIKMALRLHGCNNI